MFKWFKRIRKLEIDKTSNLNPLYTARLADLSALNKVIDKINNSITDLNNRLDQLPPIPDLTHYARKDQTNTFTEKQTFNNGMYLNNKKIEGLLAPTNNGDATHKKYVDDADNAKLSEAKVYADTKSNEKLQEAKTYADTKDNQKLEEAKQYTNDEINKIGAFIDKDNIAYKNKDNIFEARNQFTYPVTFDDVVISNASITQNKQVATKEYVDNKASGLKIEYIYGNTNNTNFVEKRTLSSGVWSYVSESTLYIRDSNVYSIDGTFIVSIRINKIEYGGRVIKPYSRTSSIVRKNKNESLIVPYSFTITTWTDMKPGSDGSFNSNIKFDYSILRIY